MIINSRMVQAMADFFSTLTFPLKSFTLISTVKSFAMQSNMETQASNYDINI